MTRYRMWNLPKGKTLAEDFGILLGMIMARKQDLHLWGLACDWESHIPFVGMM